MRRPIPKDCKDDDPEQSAEWMDFQDVCYAQVDKDIVFLRCPHNSLWTRDMVAAVLALLPEDPQRFETMYEVLKITEDKKFWRDIWNAYQSGHATHPDIAFSNNDTLWCHALAVEKIYKKHGLDKLEELLINPLTVSAKRSK